MTAMGIDYDTARHDMQSMPFVSGGWLFPPLLLVDVTFQARRVWSLRTHRRVLVETSGSSGGGGASKVWRLPDAAHLSPYPFGTSLQSGGHDRLARSVAVERATNVRQ
jgi:hypothetical protein